MKRSKIWGTRVITSDRMTKIGMSTVRSRKTKEVQKKKKRTK